MDIEAIRNLLNNDCVRNLNLLNFISENPVLGVEQAGNSILVRGESDRPWVYVSSTSAEDVGMLAGKLDLEDIYFAAIEDWMLPILCRGREIVWQLSTIQFILPEETTLPKPRHEVSSLSIEDAGYVYDNSNYKEYLSVEYVRNRILCGPSAGIRENNQLVAWAMTQDDGAMGFLHVLEEYRNKGYAISIVSALVERLRQRHKRPFACVEESNRQAMSLVSRLGFTRDKLIHWFQVRPL